VDVGCGDWQFSQFVNWRDVRYDGYDVVDSVVQTNQARFGSSAIVFHATDATLESLPPADLLLVKDVLQHWSNRTVQAFLPRLANYRYVLITNSVDLWPGAPNSDILDGDYRPLDVRLPPFNIPARLVYAFTDYRPWYQLFSRARWRKSVLLVDNTVRQHGRPHRRPWR